MFKYPRSIVPVLLAAAAVQPSAANEPAYRTQLLDVPAAAGGRSPNLSSGGGRVVLSWLEPHEDGHRLRYSVLENAGWSQPRDVAGGEDWFVNWADFPSVVPIDDSLWAAHWLVRQPAGGYAYDIHLSLSTDGGETWTASVLPHDDGTPTEHGFVTLFPHDAGLGLVWLDGRDMAGASHGAANHAGMTLRYASFDGNLTRAHTDKVDGLVCDCCQTDVALTDAGPVAVYRNRTEAEVRDIYVMRYVDGAWQEGQPVAGDGWVIGGCPVNGPTITADGLDVAVAWFTAANEQPRVLLARSSDGGATFGTPVEVAEGDTFGRTGIAPTQGGGIAVSWLCKSSDLAAKVCLREVGRDGRAGPVHDVSGDDSVVALSVPQLAQHGTGLVAAWTSQQDGVTTIRSAHIAQDNAPTAD